MRLVHSLYLLLIIFAVKGVLGENLLCRCHVLDVLGLMRRQRICLEKKDVDIYKWWDKQCFDQLEQITQATSNEFLSFVGRDMKNVRFMVVIGHDMMFEGLQIAVTTHTTYVLEKERHGEGVRKYILSNTNDMTVVCKEIWSGTSNNPGGRGRMIATDAPIAFVVVTNKSGEITGSFFMPEKYCEGKFEELTKFLDSIRAKVIDIRDAT